MTIEMAEKVDSNKWTPDAYRYPIRPSHIDAEEGQIGHFGLAETEFVASAIVDFCRCEHDNNWARFNKEDIKKMYFSREENEDTETHNYYFERGWEALKNGKLIVNVAHDHYVVTHDFIANCFYESPKVDKAIFYGPK